MFKFIKSLFSNNETDEKIEQPIEDKVMPNTNGDRTKNNDVGPVMRAGEVAQAAMEAVEMDNPDREISIQDKVAYVRISAEHELILTRESMEECLGRPFKMHEIELNLASFSGQIDANSSRIRFYFDLNI